MVSALERAKKLNIRSAVLTGLPGGAAAAAADIAAVVPSGNTDFIQEAHEAALHYLCHRADALFGEGGADS